MKELCWSNNRWSPINDREEEWTGSTCSKQTGRGGHEGGYSSALRYPSAGPLQQMPELWRCDVSRCEMYQPNQIQRLKAQNVPCFVRENWVRIWGCALLDWCSLAQQGKRFEEIFWVESRSKRLHGEARGGCSSAKWSQMAHGLSSLCWHHTWALCTKQEATRPGATCQYCLWQRQSIQHKTHLWKAQLSQTSFCHFPACKALVDAGTPLSGEKYFEAILKLQEEFDHRFADLKAHRTTFQIFADPFSFDVQDALLRTSNGAPWPVVSLCTQS